MKWVTKLKENNFEESKLNKGITSKIKEFRELESEIADLESNRGQVLPEDMQEFESDLVDLKQELVKIDDAICLAIDKKIEKAPMMAEKIAKMVEARKGKSGNGGQAPAPKPAPQPQPQSQPAQSQPQAPAPQKADGGQVDEGEKKSTNWGNIALGVILVGLTGGLAYRYFKNK